MLNSTILYLVQSENEIPQQTLPNTAYYLIGKEVRIYDNANQMTRFVLPVEEKKEDNNFDARLQQCENRITKVWNYLSGFRGDGDV